MTEEHLSNHSRSRHFRTIFAIAASLIMLAVAFNVAVKPTFAAPVGVSEEELADLVDAIDVPSAIDEGPVNAVEATNPIQYDQSLGGSVESWGTTTPTISDSGDAVRPTTLSHDGSLLTYRNAAGIYTIDADAPMYISLAGQDSVMLVKS
jgi:hypothetical protein